MAFASLIHRSSVQIPLRFESGNSRARTSSSSSIQFAYSSMRRAGFSSTLDGGRCCQHICSNRMQCFKETSQEDFKLEDLQIGGHQSCDEDGNIKNAASDTSLDCQNGTINRQSSIRTVTFCVLAAVTFGIALGLKDGHDKASEYFAGYILEQSLSVDNLFVFILIFNYFKVPIEYQSRVLSYGIAGAIIFRAIIILLGIATIQRFESVNLLLALILLFSSYKLFFAEEEDTDLADNFIVRTCQKFIPVTAHYDGDRFITFEDGVWKATPLLLTVAVIELSDIAFAVDSIPAVFGVTRDPFIVFSSNLFAISGLRSIYTLISGSMSELEYLQPAIGIVLGFIGVKMIFDFFGYHITTEVSLGIVATCISSAVLLSLAKKSNSEE
ncbi:thylakoid membrane protein TERC, chloroplastic [Dendrobium catenatum]|uniref:thylakoid membrane protein TERC, chloroplastic n=1 Tax=Dendrobium catenatum TaxID=906689 RepID=UPI0009F34B01|nr:thylakoid membrane protein TERC, chloroplastic [Dendrobium catenatum]